MNPSRLFRTAGWFLICLLLSVLLISCTKQEASKTPTLTVGKDRTLSLSLTLSDEQLQAHTGQTGRLYELLPGESTAALVGKTPIAEQKLTASFSLSFPLEDGESGARLYSSFILLTSDGTQLMPSPISLQDPDRLAADRSAFPHASDIKGLNSTDPALANALYMGHSLVELSVQELLGGEGATATLGGASLTLNASVLARVDGSVSAASGAGLQASLLLTPDAPLTMPEYAALFDFLAARYSGAAYGKLTAFLVGETAPRTSENADTYQTDAARAAELMRLADLALRSRISAGRVYLVCSGEVSEVQPYLLSAFEAGRRSGVSFGVALAPVPMTEQADGRPLSPSSTVPTVSNSEFLRLSDVPAVSQFLSENMRRSCRMALVGLDFSASDQELQAALYTYTYRIAMSVKADFMIYRTPIGTETGLYDGRMQPRLIAEVARLADTSENRKGEQLAASLLDKEWSALKQPRPSRVHTEDIANLGTTGSQGDRWFDFSKDSHPQFTAVGNAAPPERRQSASLNGLVLVASLVPDRIGQGSGYRTVLSDPQKLASSHALSALVLPQSSSESAVLTLKLQGTAKDGRRLSYSSSISLACGTWQTVTFHVRVFTSQMDKDLPCELTLLMLPQAVSAPSSDPSSSDPSGSDPVTPSSEAPSALWLHSVNLRKAAPDLSVPLILSLVIAGFAIGSLSVLLLFRSRNRKRKR